MVMEEPKAEFVKIDMRDILTIPSCNYETSSQSGSGEDCNGCDAAMNNCSDLMDNDVK